MKTLSTCVLALVLVLVVVLFTNLYAPLLRTQPSAGVQWPAFPVGHPQTVDFGESIQETSVDNTVQFRNASYWNGYSIHSTGRREQLDQWRDWLLLTVLSSSTMGSDQLNQAMFDLPPIRRTELQALGNFEYGVTRSRAIGDSEVVALIPQGNPAQRAIDLGNIADEQRKDLGKVPSQIHVFEYAFNVDDNSATLTRSGDVAGRDIFSEKYGYHEMDVASLGDFNRFISAVDDVTYARFSDGKLRIGGRKVAGYHGITTEEVAAVWQSERNGLGGRRGSGFSLDPQFDPTMFKTSAAKLDSFLQSRGVAQEDREPLRSTLEHGDASGFMNTAKLFCMEHNKLDPANCLGFFKQTLLDNRFQKARYDGSLQGTEAGMVLFYTDLIMKLWSLDFSHSTPGLGQVDDFPNELQMTPARVFAGETNKLPETRLWLGSLDKAFQIGPDKAEILLARNATRVFAVPHNFLENRDVTYTSEPHIYDRIFMTWWNQHYEEVAHYEPQYERLNEIMKWSQIIGWLNSSHVGEGFVYLNDYPVRHDRWFKTWVATHPELTFRDWQSIGFKPRGYAGSETEALPLLSSKPFDDFGKKATWGGGVSLADREALAARSALREDANSLLRRGSLDYSESDIASGRLKTIEKIEYDLAKTPDNMPSVIARATDPQARLRGLIGEFRNEGVTRSITRNPESSMIAMDHGDTPWGNLHIEHDLKGFRINWEAREVDEAQVIARRLSVAQEPRTALRADPLIETSIQLDRDVYLVKARGSDNWIKLHANSAEDLNILAGYHARIGGYGSGSRSVDVAFLKGGDVSSNIPSKGFLEVDISPNANSNSMSFVPSPAPAATEVAAKYMGNSFKFSVDQSSGKMYIAAKDIPAELRSNLDRLQLLATQQKIDVPTLHELQIAREYSQGNFSAVAKELSHDPSIVRKAIQESMNRDLDVYDRYALSNDGAAPRLLDQMASRYGPDQPDLRIRMALAELARAKAGTAATLAKDFKMDGLHNPQRFLDEINSRINNARGLDQENLVQFQNYVRSSGDKSFAGPGRFVPVSDGGKFTVEYRVANLTRQPAQLSDVFNPGKQNLVYVHDTPGLNNIDPFSSIGRRSIESMFEHGQISIQKVSSTGLAEYRPGIVLDESSKTTLRLVPQNRLPRPLPHVSPSSNCKSQEGSQDCPDVYILSERRPGL